MLPIGSVKKWVHVYGCVSAFVYGCKWIITYNMLPIGSVKNCVHVYGCVSAYVYTYVYG